MLSSTFQPQTTHMLPGQEPGRTKARPGAPLAAAAGQLQLRLLQAYAALPDPAAFAPEHEALSKLCARAFRSPAAPSTAGAGAGACTAPWDLLTMHWYPGSGPSCTLQASLGTSAVCRKEIIITYACFMPTKGAAC
jgi:hypothetical protein